MHYECAQIDVAFIESVTGSLFLWTCVGGRNTLYIYSYMNNEQFCVLHQQISICQEGTHHFVIAVSIYKLTYALLK